MARRRAIEADELFETANRLQAEGKDVTAVALLDALGGGSLRTIYKHLEVWQQRRPTAVITAPEEIPAGVLLAFGNAWRLARQEAGREVIAAKEKAAEEVQLAQAQFQGALDAIGKLEAESEADAQQIDSFKERVSELESAFQKSQNDGAAYKATIGQLQRQLEKVEQATKVERAGRDAAIKEAAELRGLSEGLKAQNTELLSRLGGDDKEPSRKR